jgi:hypothetical protein
LPVVFAANLSDEATARGIEVDTGRLSQLLVAPVHLTAGRSGRGVMAALTDAVALARRHRAYLSGAAPRGTAPARVYGPQAELQIEKLARSVASGHSLGAAAFDPSGLGLATLVDEGAVSARGAATLQLGQALEVARWRVAEAWAGQVERRREVPPGSPTGSPSGAPRRGRACPSSSA